MPFQPAETLRNRTFLGLIVAQFLAGFNDQAIHASAMFYAIHQGILTETQAISLMPILFYAPWAIFCTLSGYLADRFSKTYAVRIWKWSEVLIALVALAGFWIGTTQHVPAGPWLVLSTVFLMGTHAAFFAPAKYGAMPEILQPHVLSRGNGILESTTFLAAILGTVAGGLLSFLFHEKEYWIGVVLLVLSLIGAVASLLVAYLPPANPARLFPKNLFKPLWDNLKVLFRSKPLALAVLGIAFFIFMVAYMRQCMYMHGETRNPRWDEFKTSLVVATVALGVGLGSPLAGFLSGGKVELGLVPLGCLGMILATLFAALAIHHTWALVAGLVVIGFFSGFYMVPLYTLLQHRAPKTTKGDLIATSNFINVTGAIAASVVFGLLVRTSQLTGLTPAVPQQDYVTGSLNSEIEYNKKGRVDFVRVEPEPFIFYDFRARSRPDLGDEEFEEYIIDEPFGDDLFEMVGRGLEPGKEVTVSKYSLRGTEHFRIRLAGTPMRPAYDNDGLPSYLFIGAALMTLGILVLLCRKLPDFFVRSVFWMKCLGRFKIKAVGMQHLPTSGPVILATNCENLEESLQVVAATDRFTFFVLVEEQGACGNGGLLRFLAQQCSLVELAAEHPSDEAWIRAETKARAALNRGDLLAVPAGKDQAGPLLEKFLAELHTEPTPQIVPVFRGPLAIAPLPNGKLGTQPIRVVFGQAVGMNTSLEEIRQGIQTLAETVHHAEGH